MTDIRTLDAPSAIDRIFGAMAEKQTYLNMGYLLLSFPLGLAYFILMLTGFSAALPLSLIFIGLPLLLAVLWVSRALIRVERFLAESLLKAWIPAPAPEPGGVGLFGRLKAHARSGRTWKGLLYLFLHFPMGVVSLALLAGFVPASIILMTLPLTYTVLPFSSGGLPVNSFDQAIFFCSVGAILALAATHLVNLWAGVYRALARRLLS